MVLTTVQESETVRPRTSALAAPIRRFLGRRTIAHRIKGGLRAVVGTGILLSAGLAAGPARAASTITIATVNNGDMVVMQKLSSQFEQQHLLPEGPVPEGGPAHAGGADL